MKQMVLLFFFILSAAGIVSLVSSPGPNSSAAVNSSSKDPILENTAENMKKRLAFCEVAIKNLQENKIIHSIKNRSVFVGPGFYLIDFDEKKSVVGFVNCYLANGRNDSTETFYLFDSLSGKKVGEHSIFGLKMY